MKILFLTGGADVDTSTERLSPYKIFNTATVYNYFLRRELDRIPGIETATYRFAKIIDEAQAARFLADYNPPISDHVICLEQRGFAKTHISIFEFFKRRSAGAVCAVCDHDHVVGRKSFSQKDFRRSRTPMHSVFEKSGLSSALKTGCTARVIKPDATGNPFSDVSQEYSIGNSSTR